MQFLSEISAFTAVFYNFSIPLFVYNGLLPYIKPINNLTLFNLRKTTEHHDDRTDPNFSKININETALKDGTVFSTR